MRRWLYKALGSDQEIGRRYGVELSVKVGPGLLGLYCYGVANTVGFRAN